MNPSLRIIHTACHDQWGGLERRIYRESDWMHKRGHHPFIIAPSDSPLEQRCRQAGWNTTGMAFKRTTMLADVYCLRRLLKDFRPHVLNTHGNIDTKVALSAAWGLSIPCVILSRHISCPVSSSWYNRLLYNCLCHRVLTTSSVAAKMIADRLNVPKDRILAIPTGVVVPERMPTRREAAARLRAELGLADDQVFVGYFGRLDPGKGLMDLVDAFARVINRCPGTHLVLVGEGQARQSILARIDRLNLNKRIHLLGYRRNPWPHYRAMDCVVLASREHEGIPQTLIEAMHARTPVIGTCVGGIPEIVTHKVTGLIVAPFQPDGLAEAIVQTLTDPDAARHRAGSAQSQVAHRYSLDVMGLNVLSVYEPLISNSPEREVP